MIAPLNSHLLERTESLASSQANKQTLAVAIPRWFASYLLCFLSFVAKMTDQTESKMDLGNTLEHLANVEQRFQTLLKCQSEVVWDTDKLFTTTTTWARGEHDELFAVKCAELQQQFSIAQ